MIEGADAGQDASKRRGLVVGLPAGLTSQVAAEPAIYTYIWRLVRVAQLKHKTCCKGLGLNPSPLEKNGVLV